MASLLIYSPKCKHCMSILEMVNSHQQFKQIIRLHNVNVLGIPQQYQSQIKSVPTLLTSNGKFLVGSEVMQWLQSLLPNEISHCEIGCKGMGICSIDDTENDDGNLFSLNNYGQSLQGFITPELKAKISRNVSDGGAYDDKI